jgi:hypothetical protein
MLKGVLVDDLRCNGSGHDRRHIYWMESWLRSVGPNSELRGDESDGLTELEALKSKSTRADADGALRPPLPTFKDNDEPARESP